MRSVILIAAGLMAALTVPASSQAMSFDDKCVSKSSSAEYRPTSAATECAAAELEFSYSMEFGDSVFTYGYVTPQLEVLPVVDAGVLMADCYVLAAVEIHDSPYLDSDVEPPRRCFAFGSAVATISSIFTSSSASFSSAFFVDRHYERWLC